MSDFDPKIHVIPRNKLMSLITKLVSTALQDDVHEAFSGESHPLKWAIAEGTDKLDELARDCDIGWAMNAGFRCDIPAGLFSVVVCGNGPSDTMTFTDIQAATARGALAAGILLVLQARLAAAASEAAGP